jgi:hypothetical protein
MILEDPGGLNVLSRILIREKPEGLDERRRHEDGSSDQIGKEKFNSVTLLLLTIKRSQAKPCR